MTPSERILAALTRRECNPRQSGEGWSARCPAHDDRRPSLSVSEGDDGRALVCCHAGCTVESVCAALGLRVADLMPDQTWAGPTAKQLSQSRQNEPDGQKQRNGKAITLYPSAESALEALDVIMAKQQGRRADHWPYHGVRGDLVAMVARYDLPTPKGEKQAKTFRPVSRHGHQWIVGAMAAPRPLYGLSQIADADLVVITEGEKAADAARSIGLTATTSAHGSQSPEKTDWSPLAGKECVILPDHDKPGCQYAETVASILAKLTPPSVVKVVELPNLPDHGDVVDWINAHGEAAEPDELRHQLESLADQVEPFQSDDWPAVRPLPDELSPVMPYEPDMLPESIGSFVSDVAERLQCPPDFAAVAILAVSGAAIGRRCGIRPRRRDDWTVVPNLWGGVVGRPSILKTPAIMAAMSMLQRLEAETREHYSNELREYETQTQLVALQKKDAQTKAKAALRNNRVDEAERILQVAEPEPPVRRRYITNDATVEKLGELLADNPNGLMQFRDELVGLLHGLDKDNQQGARAFYLEAWNGTGRFTYDRIGRGTIDIESAVVSVFGGIQPGRLGPYVRSAVQGGMDDDGLMQRFQLLVWPDVLKQWRNVDRWPDTAAKTRVFDIVRQLSELNALSAGAGIDTYDRSEIPFLRFEDAAQPKFDAWLEQLEHRLRSGEEHPAIESHLGKYRSLVPSLALIFHLVDDGSGPVEVASLAMAIRWAEYLETHARRVYNAATVADLIAAKAIWKRIEKGQLDDGFNARTIYRRSWAGLHDVETVKAGLELLAEHGHVVEQTNVGGNHLGRPKLPTYAANPRARISPKLTDKTDTSTSVSFVTPDPEPLDKSDDWGEL